MAMAPRLTEGVAAWRDPDDVLAAVTGWVTESVAAVGGEDQTMFVAEVDGEVVGFVSVGEREHFSGDTDGYVGELVVAEGHSGVGIGGRLMEQAEAWARGRGLGHLTVETGAANENARGFYTARGYVEEDVRLTRPL